MRDVLKGIAFVVGGLISLWILTLFLTSERVQNENKRTEAIRVEQAHQYRKDLVNGMEFVLHKNGHCFALAGNFLGPSGSIREITWVPKELCQ